ncbi:MAG: ATP-binding cassette domain-containing protein [Bacteroidales bacterium]|jgi:excinuclease UvrABC ATPase subunit|nr:ATP-binding cassette domain-containing protein [Bacteroidales bacterium]
MRDDISVCGIETNNLKNIDISLKKRSINVIIGPSGSGKSSLAYDTISKIGQHEFNSMFSDIPLEPDYKVRSYKNMIATIPIKQTNNNNNIRSTIGTYFNMNQHIAVLYSALLNIPYEFFVLNKEENLCPQCHGLGYSKELDINRIIDYDIPLEKCPVKCWVRYKDFYIEIIRMYCNDMHIDYSKNYRKLSNTEKKKILYGQSEKKYSVRYKKEGSYSRRTTKYFGIMTNIPMMPKYVPGKAFFTDKECSLCNGQKYSKEHQKVKLCDLSIGELMCTPFSLLEKWIKAVQKEAKGSNLDFPIHHISEFVEKAVELNLGHLFFNRTIPSLSGGELQRIRLVQVFNTQLSDLLIVLDEPLAGLSGSEKKTVYNNIKELANHHTMLIVDHHDIFYKDADVIIALGEKSGKYGGNLVDEKEYIKSQSQKFEFVPLPEDKTLLIDIINQVYNYSGINIEIAKNRLNIISGSSGVGKSTLLREYLPQYFEDYSYINQKPLMGNSHSSVATVLNIYNTIIECFAKENGKNKYFFSNLTGCEGSCPFCSGSGYILYGNDFQDKIQIVCKECEGTGFNKNLKKYKINHKNIFDVWSMSIDEAFDFFVKTVPKLAIVLSEAKEILLGHLLIGQQTASLSGGENIRIKIFKSLKESSVVYGIDEPFRGLNNYEIYTMVLFLTKFIRQKKTVIIVDHEEVSYKYFTRHIILKNDNGKLVGRFN